MSKEDVVKLEAEATDSLFKAVIELNQALMGSGATTEWRYTCDTGRKYLVAAGCGEETRLAVKRFNNQLEDVLEATGALANFGKLDGGGLELLDVTRTLYRKNYDDMDTDFKKHFQGDLPEDWKISGYCAEVAAFPSSKL